LFTKHLAEARQCAIMRRGAYTQCCCW